MTARARTLGDERVTAPDSDVRNGPVGARYLQPTAELRKLWLLAEIQRDPHITQQQLAARLGVAPSMVNGYIDELAAKGHLVKAGSSPRRMEYRITEEGARVKDEGFVLYMWDLIQMYRGAKLEIRRRFQTLSRSGVRRVVFYGAGNACEVAAIAAEGTGMAVVGIVDDDPAKHGMLLHGVRVAPPDAIRTLRPDAVIVTSIVFRDRIVAKARAVDPAVPILTL